MNIITRLSLFLTIIGVCFLTSSGFSQKNNKKKAVKGTYQIVILSNKIQPVFTTSIRVEIESKRLQDKEYVWHHSKYADIIIPSRKTISAKTFVAMDEIKYEN